MRCLFLRITSKRIFLSLLLNFLLLLFFSSSGSIGTHSDAKSDQWKTTPESLQKIQVAHKNIVHVATVSCVTLKGIKELQKEVVTVALKQVRNDDVIMSHHPNQLFISLIMFISTFVSLFLSYYHVHSLQLSFSHSLSLFSQKWMHRVIPKNYMLLQEKLQAIKDAGTSPYLEFAAFKQLVIESQIADQDVL